MTYLKGFVPPSWTGSAEGFEAGARRALAKRLIEHFQGMFSEGISRFVPCENAVFFRHLILAWGDSPMPRKACFDYTAF